MSLINDALKEARKAPPRNPPSALPPLQPVAPEPSPAAAWLLPAVVMLLMVAAIFFIGWAVAHHAVRPIAVVPEAAAAPKTTAVTETTAAMATTGATQQVAAVSPPVVTPRPVELPPTNPPPTNSVPASQPAAPKLQAIFYRPQAPSAIIDGKTVQPGDRFRQYRVKEIGRNTVTLVGADKQELKLGMGD
jgi:hypothetical protein